MAKFMCTHTVKGFTRDQYCQVAAASQQDPTVKGLQSYANLTEGKIYCVWQAPQQGSNRCLVQEDECPL